MRRGLFAALVLAAACGGPSATTAPPDDPGEPVCHPRTIRAAPCSGANWSPEQMEARMRDVTLCDRCRSDADCDARGGGRCQMLQGNTCEHALQICLYPGDACYDPQTCADRCMQVGGAPVCGQMDDPPP